MSTPSSTLGTGWGGGAAAAYADTFAPLCAGAHDALLVAAGLDGEATAGTRVLDVGTGTGTLAVRAAATGARVHAVDPDPEMIALAERSGARVDWSVAGLPSLPFEDGAFDVVLASFVVNHLPDPRQGLRELARVAAPSGRVALTIWPSGHTPQARMWAAATDDAGVVVPPGTRLPAHLDLARTADGLADLLAGAGLAVVETRTVTWTHRAAADSLWRGAEAGIGGIGAVVSGLEPAARAALREAHDHHVQALVDPADPARLRFATEALLAVGGRP